MTKIWVVLIVFNLASVYSLFRESLWLQLQAKSVDPLIAMKQVTQLLNVSPSDKWTDYMEQPTSTGSIRAAQVGSSTIDSFMATWSILEEFRDEAVKRVNLLILAATEEQYSAQALVFSSESGDSLTTLLIVTKKISQPTDPNSPVAITYAIINTNTVLKQLYRQYYRKNCYRCNSCLWLGNCCCKDVLNYAPRDHTIEELNIVKQKLTADQFIWFNQQNLSIHTFNTFVKHAISNDNDYSINLTEAIGKFISREPVKAEVLASYNDSIITAIQTNLNSLRLSSEALKMNGVERENLPIILTTLAEDLGFDNIYSKPPYSQELNSSRLSYEHLYTSETNARNSHATIKYIWILGQLANDSTFTINFVFVNITSETLVKTLLIKNPKGLVNGQKKQLNIIRTSTLTNKGDFLNQHLRILVAPWRQKTTETVLNMLRFHAASLLVPQRSSMLSYFDKKVILRGRNRRNTNKDSSGGGSNPIKSLTDSVSSAVGAAKGVVELLKSSSSHNIERIVRFGFKYFNHRSTVLKAIDMPKEVETEFINAIIMDYKLPPAGTLWMSLKYSRDNAWLPISFVYSPEGNGHYNYLIVLRDSDSIKNTVSFIIVEINANWIAAKDLLLITKSKSILGGLWSSTSQRIEEIPHSITLNEALELQQFFMVVALGKLAQTLGINTQISGLK